jgi:hypothetical protein
MDANELGAAAGKERYIGERLQRAEVDRNGGLLERTMERADGWEKKAAALRAWDEWERKRARARQLAAETP